MSVPANIWRNGVRHVDGCLSRNCPNDRIVLGDWIFQSWAVVFEWFPPPSRPGIMLAPRNDAYVLKGSDGADDFETSSVEGGVRRHHVVRRVPLMDDQRLTFLVPVRIGRPPQPFNLVFDTGSSFFGVRTQPLLHSVKASTQIKIYKAKDLAKERLQQKADAHGHAGSHGSESKENIADVSGFHLSNAVARSNKKNGPPWWAGLL